MRTALLAAILPATTAWGTVVYSQPTTSVAGNVGFGFYSHSNARPQNNFKHADNFILASDATITDVSWWGMSSVRNFTNLNNFDTFTVQFYTAPGTPMLPGVLLSSQTFTRAATTPTDTGRRAPNNAIEYAQHATLPTPVSLTAGTPYFLSISAHCLSTSGDAYLWQDADTVDGYSAMFSYALQSWSDFTDTDSSFVLESVPAPGAAPVVVAAGFFAMRRRR